MKHWRSTSVILALLVLLSAPLLKAADYNGYSGADKWEEFGDYMLKRQEKDKTEGLGYMLGGSVAGIIGVVGYGGANDVVGRSIYAISQSVGILSLGYGASLYWAGNEYSSFYYAVQQSNLSSEQKLELLRNYMKNDRDSREKTKWIRISTLVLTSAVNFYAASKEPDHNMKKAFQVLGAINLAIAFQVSF